jgi:hypothetical protein
MLFTPPKSCPVLGGEMDVPSPVQLVPTQGEMDCSSHVLQRTRLDEGTLQRTLNHLFYDRSHVPSLSTMSHRFIQS